MVKEEINVHLGKRLRKRRLSRRMTLQQVADAIGVRCQQISKYETAENGMSSKTLWRLAGALQVSVNYFYEGLPRKVSTKISARARLDAQQSMTA